jgi:phage shock protein E
MKTILAMVLAMFCGAGFVCKAVDAKPNEKPYDEVRKEIQDGKAVLIDVREQQEWDGGHVKGATLVPSSSIKDGKADLTALPKDKTIYTYCASGKRAQASATMLKDKGYQATPLKDGFSGLSQNGFETTK